jgi:hypothetical protein
MWLNCHIQNSSGIAGNSRVQTRLGFQVTVFARPNSPLRPVRIEVQRSGGCTFFFGLSRGAVTYDAQVNQ